MNNSNDPSVLYAGDSTIRQGEDGHWYHYPHRFGLKLAFLIFSLLILALGFYVIWDPAVRFFQGERATVRVKQIVREEPDGSKEVIRYRKEIPEGEYLTSFAYTVSYERPDESVKEMIMAVGSRRNAYANVNDEFEVIFFPDEDYCFGLFHHRTWAFGVGFLFVGGLLTMAAVPTLYMVGRPILIDPEAAEPDVKESDEESNEEDDEKSQ